MPAGKRRNRVRLDRPKPTAEKDAAGQIDLADESNWQNVASRFARIVPRGGRESFRFQQVRAEVSHLLELPSDSVTRTIDPTWRIKFGSRTFQIDSAFDVEERMKMVQVYCIEAN